MKMYEQTEREPEGDGGALSHTWNCAWQRHTVDVKYYAWMVVSRNVYE